LIYIPAYLFAIIGVVVLMIAALGVLKLPDALARQHAATKAVTLSVSLFIIGLLWFSNLSDWGAGWSIRLIILLMALLITLPLAAHTLARSALIENLPTPRKNHPQAFCPKDSA
jgi:multicomponent Na+:H+ antiporter subunit G